MSKGKAVTILVVDDLDTCRLPMARLLRSEGYEPLCVCDGIEALRLLETVTPDLILLDLDMPGMDGITFLQWLMDHPASSSPPVIVISGEASHGPVKKAKNLGASEVLVKAHFTAEELFCSIRRCLPA